MAGLRFSPDAESSALARFRHLSSSHSLVRGFPKRDKPQERRGFAVSDRERRFGREGALRGCCGIQWGFRQRSFWCGVFICVPQCNPPPGSESAVV